MKDAKTYRIALDCVGICVLLVIFCSCISFDICDWPSKYAYPHNSPPLNWCGSIGAFCSYYLMYYVGPGIFILLVSVMCFLLVRLLGYSLSQPILRFIGVVLLAIAGSSSFYFFWPNSIYTFPTGSGGMLGVGVIYFLQSHFALLGTFILIGAMWIVGTVLLADSIVLLLLRWTGIGIKKSAGFALPAWTAAKKHSGVLEEIWRKLSSRQAPVHSRPKALSVGSDAHLEEHIGVQGRQEDHDEKAESRLRGFKLSFTGARKPEGKTHVPKSYEDYTLPPMDLLEEPEYGYSAIQSKVVKAKAAALEQLLSEFSVNARVVAADTGPVVTMFELELGAGVKVSRISSLSNDIARALSAGAVRVVAPLQGKHTIGIEVPNSEKEKVRIKDLLQLAGNKPAKMAIPLFLGKDSAGEPLVSDLAKMPHLLIAGTTGSGKSVCINSIIMGILLLRRPDEVKMILVDPKMVELTAFNTVPHLMSPIVTETKRAVQILEWATVKMDERYSLLAEARVKNISSYNKLGAKELINRFDPASPEEEAKIPKKLPYVVIIIDELADLMMTAAKEIEAYIVRLAQKSRAVGIHIILATQRPQATVVTGLIKSNMPCRIGFRVAARMDSRIILDQNGAEALLGQGDMLFLKPGTSDLIRAQGTFTDDLEINRIVKHLKEVAEPQFHPELTQLGRVDAGEMKRDELFDDAVRVVLATKRGSVSLLQRRLGVGYARASRIIEMMAGAGILGEYKGSQAREVLITLKEYERMYNQMNEGAQAGERDLANEEERQEPAYVNEGQRGYVSMEDEQ